jgi:membrane-associated phospholipid phosphatase
MPVMIALARLYRGEHHPTDILASLVFAGLWLIATTALVRPSRDGVRHSGRLPVSLSRRKGTGRSREAEPAAR